MRGSKWSRVLRYSAEYKLQSASLAAFIRRNGAIQCFHVRLSAGPDGGPSFLKGGSSLPRDGDLEIVVSWRLIKDSECGGSRGAKPPRPMPAASEAQSGCCQSDHRCEMVLAGSK